MRRLVLLRHGVTSWNAERRFQGHVDIDLTDEGHTQAKAAASAISELAPSALWASDLGRAAQTAAYLAEATGLVPVLDARLREIHIGRFQGLTRPEVVERHGEGPWDDGHHGGERGAEAARRYAECLRTIAESLADDETAVVVSHGSVTRLGVAAFLGWDIAAAAALAPLANCGWIELDDGTGGILGSAPWRIATYNRTAQPDFVRRPGVG